MTESRIVESGSILGVFVVKIMKNSEKKDTILVVDDTPENIQVISNILYQKGLNIVMAQNGQEALNVISQEPPDLILLDVLMPDIDGFDVCKRVKQQTTLKDIPIIFLTAKTQPEDILKGFECGAVDYVTKPFRPPELLSRVFTHLELKKARDLITAQNQKLAAQNEQLQELNATKDKFFSIIAHDLKNPFNQLLVFSELIQEDLKRGSLDTFERYVQNIYDASKQGYALLRNLLEWARAQTGKISFQPQEVKFRQITAESVGTVEHHAKNKQISMTTDLPDDLIVWADLNMITTVIRNLVSNAIKFTRSGGKVHIKARNMGSCVEIMVSDSGIGMKKEDVEKLFQIDFHHSRVGTAQEKGTGLGLILCKEFVEKHGGQIRVESEVGQGSCFIITLPQNTPELPS